MIEINEKLFPYWCWSLFIEGALISFHTIIHDLVSAFLLGFSTENLIWITLLTFRREDGRA